MRLSKYEKETIILTSEGDDLSSGMNPKHLQYLMGHSEISVTLDVYTHVDWNNIKNEVQELDKKMA